MRRPSFRVLALFTVIVAALTGVGVAYAAADKTIRLNVDGKAMAVKTFSSDVAGVLHKAGVTVGPHDVVAPDLSSHVKDGGLVVVRHGRLLTLSVDGTPRQVWVTALSVQDALSQLDLAQPAAWTSVSRSLSIPRAGLSLAVRLPQSVTVLADGKRISASTTAPTVAALLSQEHVVVRSSDRINVPLTEYPTTGLVITLTRIDRGHRSQDVAVPAPTRRTPDADLYVGTTKVLSPGAPGVKVNTYRLLYRNHKVVTEKLVSSRIAVAPKPRVIGVGTKQRPRYAPSADGLNWGALAQCESGGNPRAVSDGGQYRGLYQFTFGTWEGVGGSGDPINASPSEQTYRAQLLFRRSGTSPWPVCGHYLYS